MRLTRLHHILILGRDWARAIVEGEGLSLFLLVAAGTALVHGVAFILPVIHQLPSSNDADSFIKVLWQVHASVLAITVIIVTILVTVIANDNDRTRTWRLYARKTRFLPLVWFNLMAIISEGIASLQTYHVVNPIFLSEKTGNLVLTESALLVGSLVAAAWLFKVTFNFLKDDYIEALSQEDIARAMPKVLENDLRRRQEFIDRLQGGTNGR